MKITLNNGSENQNISLASSGNETYIDFGTKLVNSDVSVNVFVPSFADLDFSATCDCTTSDKERLANGYSLKLSYRADRATSFSKAIKVLQSGTLLHTIFLRGVIIKK